MHTLDSLWGLRRFTGKVAIVTGGASGIGRACVQRLAAEGAIVWIADLPGHARDLVGENSHVLSLDMDVADPASVQSGIATVLKRSGCIDVAVNSAGIVLDAAVQDTEPRDFARIIAVNLQGTFHLCRYVLPSMIARRAGAIVNVSSDAGLVGQPSQAAYCASKGGVVQFTRAAALDAAPYGIRVNCVCPCFVSTPLLEAWISASGDPARARAEAAATQPMGRVGQPREIAAATAYLASDEARFVTGIALPVDGGSTIP